MDKLIIEPINFQQYLFCPKCHFIIENPYEIECCGTLFCCACIQINLINTEKENCSKCNKKAKYRQNSFIKRITNQIQITCSFGCGKTLPSNEIKSHMITCELREYFCNICLNYQKGNIKVICFSGRRKEFMFHLIEEHEKDILNFNDDFQNIKLNQIESDNRKKLANLCALEEAKESSSIRRPIIQQVLARRAEARLLNRLDENEQSDSRTDNYEGSHHSYPDSYSEEMFEDIY